MSLHRLFVAIDLPEETREPLARLREPLPGARWVPAEQLHLTLRFLGDADDTTLAAVREQLAAVRGTSFTLTVQGVGHFPPRRPPRVLWVGLSAGLGLTRLQQQVEAAVQNAGFPAEERPFSPHITLARLRETPPSPVLAFKQRHQDFCCPPFAVNEFHLYESTLTGKGAIHERRQTFTLSP